MALKTLQKIKRWFVSLRRNRIARNIMTFVGFVLVATLFWFVMAMNDNVQDNVEVRLNISNQPDSVTFIALPPQKFHVTVRDKGTSLMRAAGFQTPVVTFNFRDFAQEGRFRVSKNDFLAALKQTFGSNASITSSSLDSLSLSYTALPGKRVPVIVNLDATPSSGKVISALPGKNPGAVEVFSTRDILDTITRVYTEKIVRRHLDESLTITVKLLPIRGARIIPDQIKVTIPVEPLVKKQQFTQIQIDNVPDGMDLLLFPQKARVVYYVPMSRFNDSDPVINVRADYRDITDGFSNHIPLHLHGTPGYVINPELVDTSVEYTIVRNK